MAAEKDKLEFLKLSEIHVDRAWNARSGDWDKDVGTGPDSPDTGFAGTFKDTEVNADVQGGTIGSIQKRGQDNAVIVRPNPDPKHAVKVPYMLVAGFRRYEAIRRLNEQGIYDKGDKVGIPGLPQGSIKAIIRQQTEQEAFITNASENTNRKDLRAPDTAYTVARIVGSGYTQSATAQALGITQVYVSRCNLLMTKLPSKVTKAWRANTMIDGKTSAPELSIDAVTSLLPAPYAKPGTPADECEARYDALCKAKIGDKANKKKGAGWIKKSLSKATDVGTMLGTLANPEVGILEDLGKAKDTWGTICDLFCNMKEGASDAQVEKVVSEAVKSYTEAFKAVPQEEGEEEVSGVRGKPVKAA